LGHGHTLGSDLFKNNNFNNFLLVDRASDSAVLPFYEDDPVKLLWLVPITDQELAYRYEHSAENLMKQLESSQSIPVCKPRASVV